VYYLQYAHTRVASLIRRAPDAQKASREDCSQLTNPSEIALLRVLWQYPYLVAQCARLMAPHLLTVYLKDLSAAFHAFYDRHRVITEDLSITRARLELSRAVQSVLKDGLSLLGVSAPEKM
jgi:arginyl-tRNA synthetase